MSRPNVDDLRVIPPGGLSTDTLTTREAFFVLGWLEGADPVAFHRAMTELRAAQARSAKRQGSA
jgi:hypothetical protein